MEVRASVDFSKMPQLCHFYPWICEAKNFTFQTSVCDHFLTKRIIQCDESDTSLEFSKIKEIVPYIQSNSFKFIHSAPYEDCNGCNGCNFILYSFYTCNDKHCTYVTKRKDF